MHIHANHPHHFGGRQCAYTSFYCQEMSNKYYDCLPDDAKAVSLCLGQPLFGLGKGGPVIIMTVETYMKQRKTSA